MKKSFRVIVLVLCLILFVTSVGCSSQKEYEYEKNTETAQYVESTKEHTKSNYNETTIPYETNSYSIDNINDNEKNADTTKYAETTKEREPSNYYETKNPYASNSKTYYIGNVKTKKYHLPSCSYLPSAENSIRIEKSSISTYEQSGYKPCKHCQ